MAESWCPNCMGEGVVAGHCLGYDAVGAEILERVPCVVCDGRGGFGQRTRHVETTSDDDDGLTNVEASP